MGKPVKFSGTPASAAYLNDASRSVKLWGEPRVSVDDMIQWTAQWIMKGGRNLNKPTHFAVTDGQFLDTPSATGGN